LLIASDLIPSVEVNVIRKFLLPALTFPKMSCRMAPPTKMWGGGMENQEAERSPISAAFGRRKFRPRVCVVDGKPHIRSFLSDALEDLGFITCECERSGELAGVLNAQVPDLISPRAEWMVLRF
jgi:hypothetical protein